ncbi:MAG: extracellular solute-binding protein [Oscillospiraceae bacterium]|nr:extracellular solute-binding protein [Oscillospiraceae bacterium]
MTASAKRRGVCLLLAMLAFSALILSGCHGSRNRSAFLLPETFDDARQINITFWAKNDTNKVQTAIYEKAIRDFEALYPNITVTMRLYTDYGRIYNDVITNIATDTTPNVCITYPDHIATYLTGSDVVVPLDDLLTDPRYGLGGSELRFDSPKKDEVVPEFLQECSIGGQIYALPYMRSTEACYVNKTFVEKLGYTLPEVLTWDFVWEVSDAAAKKDSSGTYLLNGQKVMIPFLYKSTDNMMIQMLRQLDAGYSDADGKIEIFNDTTKSLLETIAGHVRQGAFSTFKISSYPANFLNAGQCVFAVDSTAGSTWMGSKAPLLDISADKVVDFETVVMTIPQFDTSRQRMISQGPSVCMFNKQDRQEVLASWLFLQYLLSNEVQIAYAETEGYVPVTRKAQQSDEYQDYLSRIGEDNDLHYDVKILTSQLLLAHTEDTFVTPVFNGSASLRDAAGQMIENVTKSVRRKEAVNDAYYEKLYADMVSLYHLNLDGTGASAATRQDLGPLPHTSVVLLASLVCAWILIALYFCIKKTKKRKADHS